MEEVKIASTRDEIRFIDTTVRDGNQSLWDATGITTAMILSIAPVMDRIGFKAIDFISGAHMVVSVRWHKENPWQKIRLVRQAMPRTPLSFGTTGKRFMGFKRAPDSVIALAIERVAANGIRRLWSMDAANEIDVICQTAQLAKAAGIEEVLGALCFSISPVHTDEYYAQRAQEMARCPAIDTVYIKDQGGLLTPDRVRTLVPVVQQNINGRPLEFHSHCTTGLAPICYLEAIRLGVRVVHTAIPPLAYGTSQPSVFNVAKNVRRLGYSANLDEEALETAAAHFRYIAEREGRPIGAPVEHDVYYYQHQVPGGMMTTLKRHLSEVGMEHRLEEVLEEVIQVRKELGYPIMVTPFSQFVGTQATANIISGERYKVVPTEIIEYVAGYFGESPAPIDQNVLDKVTSSPRAKDILNKEFPQPSIEELRRKIGPELSDEELLLRIALPEKEIDDMLAAGPIKLQYP
jgi:oxaloacetate decarboxylase alpha subunit